MTDILQDRNARATEYLACMQEISAELERAIHAIAENAVTDLEESVSSQQTLSIRLRSLAEDLSANLNCNTSIRCAPVSADILSRITSAAMGLQNLNRRYAALLQHASRCTDQMVSLLQSFHRQEGTGVVSKHQTFSCQV